MEAGFATISKTRSPRDRWFGEAPASSLRAARNASFRFGKEPAPIRASFIHEAVNHGRRVHFDLRPTERPILQGRSAQP